MTRGAIAIVSCAAAAALLPLPAWAVERWYSTLVYPALQNVLTPISNVVPFALFDALLVAAICTAAIACVRAVRRSGWLRGGLWLVRAALVAAAAIYLVFLATWGLNYRRVSMVEKVVFEPSRISHA